jgi:phosphatidate cytidylyltransferase
VAWSELQLRWLTAVLLVPPALLICFIGGPLFVASLSAVAVIGVYELQGLLRAKAIPVHRGLGLIGAAALPWVVYAGEPRALRAFLTAALLAGLARQLRSRTEGALAATATAFFSIFYVSWLLSYGVSLRFAAADFGLDLPERSGFFFVTFALTCAVGSDAGGFFVGRRFGRRKLAPRLSPGKTVEGALGAVCSGTALGLAIFALFRAVGGAPLTGEVPAWILAAAGAAIAAAAIGGDLIESAFKRDAARKDAGHLLPGIGGILDRIDSVLLAFPVLYYCLLGYYALAR